MSDPLHGKHILLTRSPAQSQPLQTLLEQRGAQVSVFAAIHIDYCTPPAAALQTLTAADWLIFTSRNAVVGLARCVDDLSAHRPARTACIGPATAQALTACGVTPTLIAPAPHNSEALLACAPVRDLRDSRIVIVRGVGGRTLLADTLTAQGNRLDALEVYRRCQPTDVLSLAAGAPDAICFASADAATNLVACTAPAERTTLLACPVIAGSVRIARACAELGFRTVHTATHPGDDAMATALGALSE